MGYATIDDQAANVVNATSIKRLVNVPFFLALTPKAPGVNRVGHAGQRSREAR